jgi:NOL1/NOP2/fmu family ribosome biogenesis protein
MATENDPDRFDRLPATTADRTIADRPTRRAVLDWWAQRFGIDPGVFAAHSFWERGAGKIWTMRADVDLDSPVSIEALGMHVLRTRGEHWKPTLESAQRFAHHATRNVIHLPEPAAEAFLAGETTDPDWAGDWGYLLVTHEVASGPEPIGVGLYVHDELRSQVPKGRRRDL